MTQPDDSGGAGNALVSGLARVGARAWRSPTVTSWMSIGMRALSVLAVLPLLLTRFSVEETAVWYLLVTLIGLQSLADLGFAPTFVRVLAFAMGGAKHLKDLRVAPQQPGDGVPDWEVIARIWSTMAVVYRRLMLGSVAGFLVVGTLSLLRPVASLDDPMSGWVAWGVVVGTFAVSIQSNAFAAYLQGIGHIATLRRWETLASAGAMLTSVLVLLAGGRLLALVVANQAWVVANAVRNWWLCRKVEEGRAAAFVRGPADKEVIEAVWGSALRSGFGVALSRGVILSSGLIYAQVADAGALAAYLVAFRVMQMLMDFSNAPFYSALPQLARLRSGGHEDEQVRLAARGMRLSYWSYLVGVVAVGVAAPSAFELIDSNTDWISPALWATMSVAFLVERFGAMHIQLYSTTNHIIWHVANGVSGSIYLLVSFLLLSSIGVYAFPVGILVGYLAFYSWYAPLHVYRTFRMDFWQFQRTTILVPAILILIFAAASLLP